MSGTKKRKSTIHPVHTVKEGGACEDLERQLGLSVISSHRASDYIRPVEDAEAKELPKHSKSEDE